MKGYNKGDVRVQDLGARLNVRSVEQPLVSGSYVDNTVLLAESEEMLQKIVDEFNRVCKRRKLKVRGVQQPLVAGLYADDTVLLAESEEMLQRIVDEFERVFKRRNFKFVALGWGPAHSLLPFIVPLVAHAR